MNKTWRLMSWISATVLLTVGIGGAEVFEFGRQLDDQRDFAIHAIVGTISEIEGGVQETTRAFYDATDQSFKQDAAESFDLNDFGMEDGYTTLGVAMEKKGKYVTVQFDTFMMNPKVEAVAKRNYYIGVGKDIEYEGGSYEYMKIPEGTPFTMELLGAVMQLRGLITPFTLTPVEGLRITPSLDLGLFLFAGQYDVDAGPTTGVTQYQYPPKDYAIGGQSEGLVGIGMPEFGGGVEVRIGPDDGINLVLDAHATMFKYQGGTAWLTSSQHREKDIDLEHFNYRGRCTLEFPFESGRCLSAGIQYQLVESTAEITAQEATLEEIIERRERFDKNVNFRMATLAGVIGLTF